MPITRAEWRWVIVASVLVLLLSTIPYLAGYLSETTELRFGGAVFDRADYSYIPARIGQRVYVGHEMETANYPAKSKIAARFFSAAMDDAERQAVPRECSCRFVFWGPHERALGSFQPDAAGYLRQVYATRDVTIYKVIESQ